MPVRNYGLAKQNAHWPGGQLTAELLDIMDQNPDNIIVDATWADDSFVNQIIALIVTGKP